MPETHTFQAEVRQLLDIVIHSLYTYREIFLRELVSNASDALEKLRHIQLTEKDITSPEIPLEIAISTDSEAGTITITDAGLGMTSEELVQNLGTIAHSGSKAFLTKLKEQGSNSENLIGQFGVGFYAAFMVAAEVKVFSRSWKPGSTSAVWSCDGSGSYTVEDSAEELPRGCRIVLKLKDEHKEYADKDRLEEIIRKYSSFVNFPVLLEGEKVNKVEPIWLRQKSTLKDEDYAEFYKFHANTSEEPLTWLHFSADSPVNLNSVLFVPGSNPEAFGFTRAEPAVALHCRRVLIDAAPQNLFPEWLRFLKGVVDSADLPLNISRETMQDSALIAKLRKVLVKKLLRHLDDEATSHPEKFAKFHKEFRVFLKEGVATDYEFQKDLAKLLRWDSTLSEAGKPTGLADYISRMKEGQTEIYFLSAPTRAAVEASAYLEPLRSKGYEVLVADEPADEFVFNHLREFEGKKIVSADQASVEIDPPAEAKGLSPEEAEKLCNWLKETLGERVSLVGVSKKLAESPVAAYSPDAHMTPALRRMLRNMPRPEGETAGPAESPVNLEINPRHDLLVRLNKLRSSDEGLAALAANNLCDAALAAAGLLDDTRAMAKRSFELLNRLG